ncbi:MAG: YbaK/EbsC family protein, partial [Candidatus Peribacteraceae bacterium]|nr:YbaK/EbsC family protein [Candidatus Peribacteraceae bacterium]
MNEAIKYLDEHSISHKHYVHEPVATIEDLDKLPKMDAEITKNLFLKDKSGQFILATVGVLKRVDLKELGNSIGSKKLKFASAEDLKTLL